MKENNKVQSLGLGAYYDTPVEVTSSWKRKAIAFCTITALAILSKRSIRLRRNSKHKKQEQV